MKKVFFTFLAALMGFTGFVLLGELHAAAQPGSENWPTSISISTPPVRSGAYGANVALGSLITKYMGIPVTVEGTPGDRAGLTILFKKESEFANASALPGWEAYRGTGQFKQLGRIPLRLVAGAHAVYLNIATLADSGIKTIEDIKGKRLMYLNPGAVLLSASVNAILDAYGLQGQVKALKTAGLKGSISALVEGRTDVIAYPTGLGSGDFIELATTKPTRFISLDKSKVEKINDKRPFFSGQVLPAKTYKNQDKDVLSLGMLTATVTRDDIPESLVYAVVKMLWEHADEFRSLHPAAKEWAEDDILEMRILPWHPGVVKYYKEKGKWTSELEKAQQKLLSE
ncbi:MAG: TAXI family TRAP transporter solute-binding subunit [Desulfobacterales bacterium]|nr:TAXI family TRAP transporter solute-binding subunit [Desulfobacterales bacterium]